MNDRTTDTQLTEAQIVASGLVDTCRLVIAGGADPAAVMDATLILAARTIGDHLEPEQATEFADWLRRWADAIEQGQQPPERRH